MSIRVKGIEKVVKGLERLTTRYKKGSKRGAIRAGLLVLGDAQAIVPVDEGNLKASGFVSWGPTTKVPRPEFKGDTSTVWKHRRDFNKATDEAARNSPKWGALVSFAARYAIYVHENVAARHKAGKVAKFLEKSFNFNRKKILSIVAEEARRS